MILNEREKKILAAIRKDPYISQQDLADQIGLSRSTIANLISGLVKKDYLVGKAYILVEKKPVICIGAANIDRRYSLEEPFTTGTITDAKERFIFGGCARNVAENLGRLGIEPTLLSIAGNDACWQQIKEHSEHFMDVSQVDMIENESTGVFVEVLDTNGAVEFGLTDMNIYKYMTPEWLSKNFSLLKEAEYLVADLNLPKETLELLISFKIKYQIPLILISVSVSRMKNLPTCLNGVDLLIVKYDETEAYLDMPVNTAEEMKQAALKWLTFGLKSVAVTKNDEMVTYITDKKKIYQYENTHDANKSYNWGLNEAGCAGIIYAYKKRKSAKERVLTGIINAYHTSKTLHLIRPNLSASQLERDVNLFSEVENDYHV
ncbi:PfkB family carbohydrate kinase [Carnobacterium funditum]|uniref:PfkB family carbohydrate kinase n=1 Tax=Carnobacterium funditum TaxID=2752 RepID=UPI000554FACF|nr:PfkB family carbohydrate kinase [Carnobacterium funditum]